MKLGLNISHDSGAAITDSVGNVLSAVSEERITRIKNHMGIPTNSIDFLFRNNTVEIDECVIGGNKDISKETARQLVFGLYGNPSSPSGKWFPNIAPGQSKNEKLKNVSAQKLVESELTIRFPHIFQGIKFTWDNHHDSHLGCAVGISQGTKRLLISLDNAGDGESGAIGITETGSFKSLSRISSLDSLGALYSAVTERYNFKEGSHEGKITGLAAMGISSEAVEILSGHIRIKNGNISLVRAHKLKDIAIGKAFSNFGINLKSKMQLSQIIDLAESKTVNYADLAFAIQKVLEDSVIEIVKYWSNKTQIHDVSLAGGVFANVKLNQKLSESKYLNDVQVFPHMGDGGIALGSIWSQLAKRGELSTNNLFENMYLAPQTSREDTVRLNEAKNDLALEIIEYSEENFAFEVATCVNNGMIVAQHSGNMEFGPRALGNRSLLVDPRRSDMVSMINKRLKRTEFMPLAPIVMAEAFDTYFIKSSTQSLIPFEYMTMTCNVKDEWRTVLPAVTHVDGTARPQILTQSTNKRMYGVLEAFSKISGLHLLVNTSLNIHEEPINFVLEDSIKALKLKAFDILFFENFKITLRNN